MKLLQILFLSLFLFHGDSNPDVKENLLGVWKHIEYKEGTITFVKVESIRVGSSAIKFLKEGKLIKRQNAGGCGTPPITYGNFIGTWNINTDDVIDLKYRFWGGEIEAKWSILSLSKDSLKIKRLGSETIRKR